VASTVREAIVEAALRLSAEKGIAEISTAEVCRAAGASNGSMFHHFPTKDALAAALYLRALARYQQAVVAGLPRARSARTGIRSLVLAHVKWVLANPAEARLLHELRHTAAAEEEIKQNNRAFLARVAEWLKGHVEAGVVRALSFDVFFAVVFGPLHVITREWLRSGDARRLRALAPDVAEAVWCGLAARRGERHR